MYKLIAIDIDGTLLNSKGELTKRNAETIRRVTSKGVKVVLTSGRVTNSVRVIANMINADNYMICDNGASIYDIQKEKRVFAKYIDKGTVLKILDFCLENNIYYMIFTTKEIIVKDLKHMALAFYRQRHNVKSEESGISEIRYGAREYVQKITDDFVRIIVCDQDRPIYNAIINKLKRYDDIEIMASPHVTRKVIKDDNATIMLDYSYAELLPKGVNKWFAISKLIEKLDIKREEVIAIGDNFNDIEMIKNAGLGVAVNNGSPVAKEVARIVAPSNDQDGVAMLLEQYVLNNV